MIKPQERRITDLDGVERVFMISRLPATVGREVVTQYPVTAMPKVGDYKANEAQMLLLMSHVAVVLDDGTQQRLTTKALIDNHTGDWECLARLEAEMIRYNTSFFSNGKASTFFEAIAQQLRTLLSQTLTDLSAQSSRAEKRP